MLDIKKLTYDELRETLIAMKEEIEAEGRSPTDKERELAARIIKRMDALEAADAFDDYSPTVRPHLGASMMFNKSQNRTRVVSDEESPPALDREDKEYRNMFYGSSDRKLEGNGFKDDAEFYAALISQKYDPRMVRASMIEGIQSEGGFSVPEEQTAKWLDSALEDEIIRPLAAVWPMKSNSRKVPGFDGFDRSDGKNFGGLQMEFLAEEGTASKQVAKLRMIELAAKKGAIYSDVSNELMADGLGFKDQLQMALRKSISRGMDNEFINGTGAGRPQGILAANSLISVSAETGQSSSTIVYANIVKQFARMYAAGRKRAVFLASDTCIPEIMQMGVPVGTAGSHVPVLKESNGKFSMLGRPVYFSELMPALGSANCVVFCDVSQYAIGMRKEMSIDVSNAPGWTQDLTSLRIIVRFDGQSTWNKAITPKNGDSQSWVVGIDAI